MVSKANARKKARKEHMKGVGIETMSPELALLFNTAFNMGWNSCKKDMEKPVNNKNKHLLLCSECASYQLMSVVNGKLICDVCGSDYHE